MAKKEKKKKKKNYTAIYFFAAAFIATVAINAIIRENRRVQEENELLSYEVW